MFGTYADFFSDIDPPTFLGDPVDADAAAGVMANVLNNSAQFVPPQPDGSFITTVLDPMTEITSGEFYIPFDFDEVENTVNSILVSFNDEFGVWSLAEEGGGAANKTVPVRKSSCTQSSRKNQFLNRLLFSDLLLLVDSDLFLRVKKENNY